MQYLIIPILGAITSVLNPSSVYADIDDQLFKLVAYDAVFSNVHTTEYTRPEGVTDPMALAAIAFLASLDKEQLAACTFEFGHTERRHWQPVPMGDAGVRLDEMTKPQRASARKLLQSVLSERGLATVDGVLVLGHTNLPALRSGRGYRESVPGTRRRPGAD